MPTLPRTSLASLVCPSAPFLAPRLLRTYTPLAALPSQCLLLPTPGRRHNSTGKTFRKTKVNERQVQQRQLLGHVVEVRQQLRQACDDRDLKALMDLYPSFIATGHLQSRDETRKIAQALHVCARTQTAGRVPFESVLPFIQQVIEDIKKGSLPPHPMAFVHLLGIYRDRKMYDEGYALWQWLSQQDDNYLSQAVYGAAIELLAYSRQVRLPELENLYLDALQRFPGTFAQYHLSPDAIVPDRGQPTLIANLPITLLQGITTARIFHNDWKNAYLALDTALRLYPAQLPARFFELFVYNRPLEEGYTAFLVACRAGIIIPPGYLSGLIAKIRKAMEHCDLLRDRAVLLRAIANATYAYLQAGGSLQPIHVAAFLTSFGSLLPEPASGENYEGDMASIRNIIVTRAHETLSTWFQAGLPPSPNAFTALINLAGRLRVPDLLRVSLHDIETAQVNIGDIGLRTVLTSAGQTGAKDLIEETWASIVHKADSMGRQIDWRDWICLSKACRRAQHLDYFNAQLSEQEHAIPTPYKDMIVETLDNELPHTETTMQSLNPDAFETQFAELNQQIKNITAVVMSGQRLNIQQNPFYMSLDPEKLPLANILVLRDVYNEYTVDPHQPPAEDATPFRSSTGIPLDELRFANWVSVVEMMDQADKLDKERREAIRRTGSDVTQATTKNPLRNTHNSIISLDRLRKRIKSLREVPVGQPTLSRRPLAQLSYNRPLPLIEGLSEPPTPDSMAETRPFRIMFHKAGKKDMVWRPSVSKTENSPWSRPQYDGNNLQLSYHMVRSDRDMSAPAPEPESDPQSASTSNKLSRRPLLTQPPKIKYFVSLKSHHDAPEPSSKLSFRPLGKRMSPKHHLLRGLAKEEGEETAGDKEAGDDRTEALMEVEAGEGHTEARTEAEASNVNNTS